MIANQEQQQTFDSLNAPKLKAYRKGQQLYAWCSHCHYFHIHGAAAGHRWSHCSDRSKSPYYFTGYELVVRGTLDELIADLHAAGFSKIEIRRVFKKQGNNRVTPLTSRLNAFWIGHAETPR
jgi:hypothetical protein